MNAGNAQADLNGDGRVDPTDRQVLYANYGWRANRAPVGATRTTPTLTHTDLAVRIPLASIAQDFEGDEVFWRVTDATHGTAILSDDGKNVIFTPKEGATDSISDDLSRCHVGDRGRDKGDTCMDALWYGSHEVQISLKICTIFQDYAHRSRRSSCRV